MRFSKIAVVSTFLLNGLAAAQWTAQPSGLPSDISAIAFSSIDANVVWATGFSYSRPYQGFLKTVDGGKTWRVRTIPNNDGLWFGSVFASDSSKAWISTVDLNGILIGGIIKTENGGSTWIKQVTAFPASGSFPNFVYFFDAVNGICMGDPTDSYFEIYTTVTGGDNWTRVTKDSIPSPLTGEFGILNDYAAVGDKFWFGTSAGRIYHSNNRGRSWTVASAGIGQTFIHCAFQDENIGLATRYLPSNNRLARTTDGGKTWTVLNSLPGISGSIRFIPGTKGSYIITSDGGLQQPTGSAYTLDSGITWKKIDDLSHGYPAFISPTIGWVGGENFIYKWAGPVLPITEISHEQPAQFALHQNYPNPFNPSTAIRYALPKAQFVTLKIFNMVGQQVATLVHRQQDAGEHSIQWHAEKLLSGVYTYRLETGEFSETKKMILLR